MILSDWISNIRWKYFTNQKAGLIFKELMGEFRMVEQMTENKRYSEQNLENHLNRIYDNHECKVIFDDEIIDLLNEQEETIQNQKEYILRMGHGTIFEEMKRLKERNQRQYYSLKKICDLIYARDWKTLESIVEGWEEFDRLSQAEFGNYGDDVNE